MMLTRPPECNICISTERISNAQRALNLSIGYACQCSLQAYNALLN